MLAHPGVENSPVHQSGGALHKSISTPSMAQGDLANHHASANKSNRRQRVPEPTHVFIQKLIAEHGWSNQRSCTDSETEGEEAKVVRDEAGPGVTGGHGRPPQSNPGYVASPQLTLAEFLQKDLFSPALSEEERRKQRRNKKERGGSLFSLRKKKD